MRAVHVDIKGQVGQLGVRVLKPGAEDQGSATGTAAEGLAEGQVVLK